MLLLTESLAVLWYGLHRSDDAAMTPRTTLLLTRNEPEDWFVVQLHTFGDALVRVGEREVRPSAPVVFAALLYLSVERGRRVPRAALQELLFPETDERSGAHSMRQLLYKLRRLGTPLEADQASVMIPAERVVVHGPNGDAGSILPGYTPALSEGFLQWVERYRSQYAAASRTQLLRQLGEARQEGNVARVSEVAATLLALDPLNEEATLAQAEALALAGQKVEAVRLLEAYAQEVGATSPTLRLPADLLRKRISDRFVVTERPPIPLMGRAAELSELLAHFQRAAAGNATVSVIWGDPGIGKTRLVEEYRLHLAFRPTVVEVAHCRPHDTGRPMGAMVDLVPRLLKARGALAVSPSSMLDLRRLVGQSGETKSSDPADVIAGRIRVALEDLILSVCSEATLVIVIEDAHWLDEVSLTFLHSLLEQECRLHLVITRRTQPQFAPGQRVPSGWFSRQLEPLSSADSHALLMQVMGEDHPVQTDVREHCVSLAAGNALFLCTIGEHLRQSGSVLPSKASLTDMLRQRVRLLSPRALLLLRFVAALGTEATQSRLKRSLDLPTGEILLAIQELSERGLIAQQRDALRCSHDLLAELVLTEMPAAVRVGVMEHVARTLEEDGTANRATALLWACADCWHRAENPGRAANALRQCADLAMDIGQPTFAIEALERAQQYVPENELEPLIAETIQVADDACDIDTVFANVERIHRHRARLGLDPGGNTMAEFALVNARRRTMLSVWAERSALERLAFDRTAHPAARVRAARSFLIAAEEEMDRDAAEELFARAAQELKPHVPSLEWSYLELIYHRIIGDILTGSRIAENLIAVRSASHAKVGLVAFGDASLVMYRAGFPEPAMRYHQQLLEEADKIRIGPLMAGFYTSQAAMMAMHQGDRDTALQFHERSRRLFARTGDEERPAYLANSMDFAVASGDAALVRSSISKLRTRYADCFTPNRERITLGHSLIADWLEKGSPDREHISRATSLFELGKTFAECDTLAVGLALAIAATNGKARAQYFIMEYLRHWRRDRFPFPPHFAALMMQAEIELTSE